MSDKCTIFAGDCSLFPRKSSIGTNVLPILRGAKIKMAPWKRPRGNIVSAGFRMPVLALLALGLATPALAAPDIAPIGLRPDFAAAAVRAPACGAGTPVPEGALTLAELVDLALCRSPVTSGSWASVRSAAARRGQTRALYGPSIDAAVGPDAGFSRRWGGGFPASTDWSTSAAASLSLRWLLFDFGGREARFSAADANLEAAIASFADQAQAVVLETALAYNGLLSSSAAEEAARANLEFARASLEAATAREAAGVAIRSERLQADAALAQANLPIGRRRARR